MVDSVYACSLCPRTYKQRYSLNRHMLNNKNVKYSCEHCRHSFNRVDRSKRHLKKCLPSSENEKKWDICQTLFTRKYHMTRHRKNCVVKQTVMNMKQAAVEYDQKLERGKMLEDILRKYMDTKEETLDDRDKECLRLYQQSVEENMDMDSVHLKAWQEKVISFIDEPSDRTIYWVVGRVGNEGKTFIQKYIHKLFGSRRVLKSEVNSKKADIAYILSQESLTCKDIFLFNLLRSDIDVAYGLLENLKDGYLISSKYRSKPLKIQTPNTVIVFSNSLPTITQLSDDRWKVYEILKDKLFAKSTSSVILSSRKVDPYRSTKNYTAYYD